MDFVPDELKKAKEEFENKTLSPGSDEAVAAGCTCPVADNYHGKGLGDHSFYISGDCPLHGSKKTTPNQSEPNKNPLESNGEVYSLYQILTNDKYWAPWKQDQNTFGQIVDEILDWHTKDKEAALRALAEDIKNSTKHGSFYSNGVHADEDYASRIDDCLKRALGGKE